MIESKIPSNPHFSQRDWQNGRDDNERYVQRMDAVPDEKFSVIDAHLGNLPENAMVYSVGAGSGQLEEYIANQTGAVVFASDKSPAMLKIIQEKSQRLTKGALIPVAAEGELFPLAKQSTDAIVCFSVIHEIASFNHGYSLEPLSNFFADALERLKPGGKLIIRDFMQSENPQEILTIKLGTPQVSGEPPVQEMDPRDFLQFFVDKFVGDDTSDLKQQILAHQQAGTWTTGATISLTRALATELLAHASWQSSKEEEVTEKYAYLPAQQYAQFIQKSGAERGIETKIIQATATVLPGYRKHLLGRFDVIDPSTHEVQDLPAWTGVVVIERRAAVPEPEPTSVEQSSASPTDEPVEPQPDLHSLSQENRLVSPQVDRSPLSA